LRGLKNAHLAATENRPQRWYGCCNSIYDVCKSTKDLTLNQDFSISASRLGARIVKRKGSGISAGALKLL
jgi:hypothetical protein